MYNNNETIADAIRNEYPAYVYMVECKKNGEWNSTTAKTAWSIATKNNALWKEDIVTYSDGLKHIKWDAITALAAAE